MTKNQTFIGPVLLMILVFFAYKMTFTFHDLLKVGDIFYKEEINPFEIHKNTSAEILQFQDEWILYRVIEPKLTTMTNDTETLCHTNSSKRDIFMKEYSHFYKNVNAVERTK